MCPGSQSCSLCPGSRCLWLCLCPRSRCRSRCLRQFRPLKGSRAGDAASIAVVSLAEAGRDGAARLLGDVLDGAGGGRQERVRDGSEEDVSPETLPHDDLRLPGGLAVGVEQAGLAHLAGLGLPGVCGVKLRTLLVRVQQTPTGVTLQPHSVRQAYRSRSRSRGRSRRGPSRLSGSVRVNCPPRSSGR